MYQMPSCGLFLLALLCFSCSENVTPLQNGDYIKIQSRIHLDTDAQVTMTETMRYSDDGQLLRVDGLDQGSHYATFTYDEERRLILKEKFLIEGDRLESKQEFFYNATGRLAEIREYLGVLGNPVDLVRVHRYEFNKEDQSIRKISYNPNSNDSKYQYDFTWRNNNLVKVEHRNAAGDLEVEYAYSYDDKINPFRSFPAYLDQEFLQSANNLVESEYTDYTGIIDTYCNPCKTKYKYNGDKLPKRKDFEWERSEELVYE